MTAPAGLIEQVHAAFRRHRPVELDANLFEAGFSSSILVEVREALSAIEPDLTLIDLYRYPTVRSLAAELARRKALTGYPAVAPAPPPWAARADPQTPRVEPG